MFDELTQKLESVLKNIRGQGKLTESNMKVALRDIRRSLLEADVNFKVARRFISEVEQQSIGKGVLDSITPGQMIVKIIHDELVRLLGGSVREIQVKGSPEIMMVCGLQGSGKTTSVAKLANYFKKKGRRPMVSSIDVHRPAAIEQLRVLADQNGIPFSGLHDSSDPGAISRHALDDIKLFDADLLIMDTAGRLHVDADMMAELEQVRQVVQPHHIFFVADGMTGQDAVNAVEGFHEHVEFDGVILTKMDGDARGGAALSIVDVTGKPILFIGTGEQVRDLEQFHPDRMASRILGMGDIVTLVERAQDVVDQKQAESLQKRIMQEGLTLDDFLVQMRQLQKMGPLEQVMGMIPGMGKMTRGMDLNGAELKRVEAIILSMTPGERSKPNIIDGSRRKRIANGSGTTVHDVNNLLKQFNAMQKMMKQMTKAGGMNMLRGMKLPF